MKKTLHSLLFTILLACYGMACSSLSSCDLANSIVEYDIQKGVNSMKPSKGAALNSKTHEKQAEQMKKEGKCPICHGAGKSPDGRYTCSACDGTGRYEAKEN